MLFPPRDLLVEILPSEDLELSSLNSISLDLPRAAILKKDSVCLMQSRVFEDLKDLPEKSISTASKMLVFPEPLFPTINDLSGESSIFFESKSLNFSKYRLSIGIYSLIGMIT